LLLCPADQYPDLCRKIQLTPFVSPHYSCLNAGEIQDFAKLVMEHGERTRQRRRYHQLKEASKDRLPEVNLPLRPSQQYMDEFMEQAPIGMFLLSRQFD